jgi:hypothetical protein
MMKIYLLHGDKALYLAVGKDPVAAANSLSEKTGHDFSSCSVGGSWECTEGSIINVGKFWPYFTCNPPSQYLQANHQ